MTDSNSIVGDSAVTKRRPGIGRLYRLARKELVEILRDRRTIITLVLMPLLVYPLLGIIAQKFMIRSLFDRSTVVYRIGFENDADRLAFSQLFTIGDQIVRDLEADAETRHSSQVAEPNPAGKTPAKTDRSQPVGPAAAQNNGLDNPPLSTQIANELEPGEPDMTAVVPEEGSQIDLQKMISLGELELGVEVFRDSNNRDDGFRIYYSQQSRISRDALMYVGQRLRLANDTWVRESMAKRFKAVIRTPGAYVTANVESKAEKPSLLTFVPLMLVLMTITGAVYPAIDLTAGERERGTMEILVSAPVSRMALLTGKFVAVVAVAMLTAIVNMLAMIVTVYTLGLESIVFGDRGISWVVVLVILFLLFVLASFFSATLLSLTSFARSFKEAQAYLIPLMLIAFAPGLLSLNPNLEITAMLAIVPLVNIVLVGRDLLNGSFDPTWFTISIISTILYGLLSLSVAARVFGADSVLTGGGTTWADLVRRSTERQPQPAVSTAMFFLAILFPSFIVISGLATRIDTTMSNRLSINAGITFGLFVLLPLLFSIIFNLARRTTFFLIRPAAVSIAAAACLGISVWVIVYEIEISSLSGSRLESLTKMFSSMKMELQQLPLGLKLICLALTPAVCEEFTFRGFLLSALSKHLTAWIAVLITAVLFGLFHVFVRDALLLERMLPSTLMGLLLGWVCLRTGSLFPGILLHVVHNGMMVTLGHYEQQLGDWGIGLTIDQSHLPVQWFVYAAIPMSLGLALLLVCRRPDARSGIQPP